MPLVVRIQDAGGHVVDPVLRGAEAALDGAAPLPAGRKPGSHVEPAWDPGAGPTVAASCPEAVHAWEDLGQVEAPASEAAGGVGILALAVCSSRPSGAVHEGRWGASDSGVGPEECRPAVESGTAES